MKVLIVGRDKELMDSLAERLSEAGLGSVSAENANSALTSLKKNDAQFVVADSALLIDQNLGSELVKRSPLIRLIGFSDRPTIPGLIEALSAGLVDYFPRTPAYLEAVVDLIVDEGRRLARWRNMLLTDDPAAGE